jgi:aspartyl aminopeptidase
MNPHYPEAYERRSASFFGSGVAWDQRGGNAEAMAFLRTLLDRAGIVHQPSSWTRSGAWHSFDYELSFFTGEGMVGIALAIPVMSRHSLFELVSKADLYEAFRAYRAFLED